MWRHRLMLTALVGLVCLAMAPAVSAQASAAPSAKRGVLLEDLTYSASGVFGDATLATREKGRQVVEAMVVRLVKEIADLRQAPVKQKAPRP